ncbi:MAG: YbaB/EbfC family nucleoid-associated protein [Rhabdochlamydiaceae bacterium]|jgi:DNA-binding YbaB/EbfC family protein
MGSGFSKMKKQARLLEEQYTKARQDIEGREFTGSAGNGLVNIVISGDKEIKSIKIKPECIDISDLEGLEDLIKAAHADASKKIEPNALPQMPFSF